MANECFICRVGVRFAVPLKKVPGKAPVWLSQSETNLSRAMNEFVISRLSGECSRLSARLSLSEFQDFNWKKPSRRDTKCESEVVVTTSPSFWFRVTSICVANKRSSNPLKK